MKIELMKNVCKKENDLFQLSIAILDESRKTIEELDAEKELTCNLMSEILGYKLDIRPLQDLSEYKRNIITELSNANESFKRKMEVMGDEKIHQEKHVAALSKIVKDLREEKVKFAKVKQSIIWIDQSQYDITKLIMVIGLFKVYK